MNPSCQEKTPLLAGRTNLPTSIYVFVDANGSVRYVGKTINLEQRVKGHLSLDGVSSRHLFYWLRKTLQTDDWPTVCEIDIVPPGEDWESVERRWISLFLEAGEPLTNIHPGGTGWVAGTPLPEETKRKISQTLMGKYKGVPKPAIFIERARKRDEANPSWRCNFGPVSDAVRKKMSESQKRRYENPEARAESKHNLAHPWTDERKKKLSESLKRWHSSHTRSEETRKRMSQGLKKYHETRKREVGD